jgi:CRISPR-associated protein Csx17
MFRGLRGPIEAALIRHAACPADREAATRLLDALVATLDRVEGNRAFRETAVELDLLPLEWLVLWLGRDQPAAEVRVAMGVTSLLEAPFLVHRWGVRLVAGSAARYRFTKEPQARCVWTVGPLVSNLSRLLQRRLVDAERDATGPESLPTRASFNIRRDDLAQWLAGELDEAELARWVDRLALFDWSSVPEALRGASTKAPSTRPVDGLLALWSLLRPLLDRRKLTVGGRALFEEHADPRTVAAGRGMVARLGVGDVEGTIEIAASRYHMAGRPLGRVGAASAVEEPLRLMSSLLFQPVAAELVEVTPRWLRPTRIQGGS